MIRLIVSDIDGTLIQDSTPDLYPEMVETIKKLKDKASCFAPPVGGSMQALKMFSVMYQKTLHILRKTEHISVTSMKIFL